MNHKIKNMLFLLLILKRNKNFRNIDIKNHAYGAKLWGNTRLIFYFKLFVPATILLFSITCLARIWFSCKICSLCRFSSATFFFFSGSSSERITVRSCEIHIKILDKSLKFKIPPAPSDEAIVVSDNIFLIDSAFFSRCSFSSAVSSGV